MGTLRTTFVRFRRRRRACEAAFRRGGIARREVAPRVPELPTRVPRPRRRDGRTFHVHGGAPCQKSAAAAATRAIRGGACRADNLIEWYLEMAGERGADGGGARRTDHDVATSSSLSRVDGDALDARLYAVGLILSRRRVCRRRACACWRVAGSLISATCSAAEHKAVSRRASSNGRSRAHRSPAHRKARRRWFATQARVRRRPAPHYVLRADSSRTTTSLVPRRARLPVSGMGNVASSSYAPQGLGGEPFALDAEHRRDAALQMFPRSPMPRRASPPHSRSIGNAVPPHHPRR